MEDAGQKLKKVRERLDLRYRDVEQASQLIARQRNNDEFAIALSRLADIENRGTVPTIYRIYSLCAIYRLDMAEVLQWYGVDLSLLAGDAAGIALERTHSIGFSSLGVGSVQIPLSLDPGIDLRKTTYLSRFIQRWGSLPVMLLNGMDLPNHRYAFVGTEDWSMHPIIVPGSLLLIDETKRKPEMRPYWRSDYERPIYLFETREQYCCAWCHLEENRLTLIRPPSSPAPPSVHEYPGQIEIIGEVTGVAMRLDWDRKRRARP